jgi:hypothetical protein
MSLLRHRCCCAANAAVAETVLLLPTAHAATGYCQRCHYRAIQQLPAHLLPLLINPRPNI